MGFGRIIGGALQGAGTGMAQMAESRELERRATALENLRSQNTRVEQQDRAQLTDLNDSRSLNRRTNAELVIGQQAGQQKAEELRIKGEQTAAQAEADRQAKAREAQTERDHDVRMTRLKGQEERMTASAKAAIEGGQVQTTFVADSGETMILTKSGKTIATGITATEKDRIYNPNSGGGLGDGGVLGEVRGAAAAAAGTTEPAAAPTPKATTAPKPAAAAGTTEPKRGTQPPKIDGVYRIMLDKDAEAFVNDPANKGKRFVGPDGKTYTVK